MKFFREKICAPKGSFDRIDKKAFQEYIRAAYKNTKLGESIGKQLTVKEAGGFSFTNSTLDQKNFVTDIEKFINKYILSVKKFVFECYDCFYNNDMITEQNLFCFMHVFEKYFDSYEATIKRKKGKTEANKDLANIVYKKEEDYEQRDLELTKKNPKLLSIN